jgi:CRP-like cAMP-binding protein
MNSCASGQPLAAVEFVAKSTFFVRLGKVRPGYRPVTPIKSKTMNLQEMFQNWEDIIEFPKKTVIFTERDSADFMYVVLSGEIELTLMGEPLGMERSGGVIGEMAMIHSMGTRSATAITLTKVKLARLNNGQFRKLVSENADFALHIMSVLANRLIVANTFITRHLT